MTSSPVERIPQLPQKKAGISRISVWGYKSIFDKQSIEIRPLTIFAGANSSGKSSIMQPVLLLKQTLEASYDPGALLLTGPNVKFTSAEQIFSKIGKEKLADQFGVQLELDEGQSLTVSYHQQGKKPIDIASMEMSSDNGLEAQWTPAMTFQDIIAKTNFPGFPLKDSLKILGKHESELKIMRDRCFLSLSILMRDTPGDPMYAAKRHLVNIIHLPGLRGNPERVYSLAAVGATFPGTFETYTASIISQWESEGKKDELQALAFDLERLGLTWKVSAKRLNDTQVEFQVGRLPHAAKGGAHDLVNIADVGFGVSQTLPIIAAIHTARPGQLVYLEQPEIHLHPRALLSLAEVVSDAAKRGIRIVAETHSSLFLLGIQALVAEGKLSPHLIKLHWFSRNEEGATIVTSSDLDEKGAFGDWPEDFDDVTLKAQSRYLDAIEAPH